MFGRAFATAAVVAVLQFASFGPALAAPPPIEAYGRLPALDQLALSPDGQKIAYAAQVGEKRRFVVQTIKGEPLGAFDFGESNRINEIRWIDGGHILIVRPDDDRGESLKGQIYAVEARRFVTVLDSAAAAPNARSGGSSSVKRARGALVPLYVFDQAWIRTIDGRPTVLVRPLGQGGDGPGALYAIDLETGYGTPFINEFHGLLDASAKASAKAEFRLKQGQWRLLADEGVSDREVLVWNGGEDVVHWPALLGQGRSPETVLVTLPNEDGGDDFYEVSMRDGTKTHLEFDNHGELRPIHDEQTGRLLGFDFVEQDKLVYVFTDQELAKAWAAIEAGFPGKLVRAVNWTPDFSKLVVETEGRGDPGTFLLVDRKAGTAAKLGSAYPQVGPDAVGEQRWVKYKAADGLEIPAFLTLPPGRDPKNLPLVVLPHGGPHARDEPGFDWWAQALAARGYAVLQPQFRGSAGFSPAFAAAGDGQWGRKMQTDLSDGVRWLAAQGTIDARRVCLVGWSYGGYAAMAGPTLDRGVYRCAVAGAGISDLRAMQEWIKHPFFKETVETRAWKQIMGGDASPDRDLDAVSPAKHAGDADAPILLIHGKWDGTVPIEQSEIMAKALKKAGKPYEYVVLENEGHHLTDSKTRLQMLQAAVAFIEKHNPPN